MSLGYDLSCATLSQEGKIYQLDYANKAIETAPTVLGVVCEDGVVLVSEKIRSSKTLVEGSNPTIYSVSKNIGIAICGLLPDGRNLFSRAKAEASGYLSNFGIDITGKILTERLAQYIHAHTLYFSSRPFGASVLISSFEKDTGAHLYMIESNGNWFEYYTTSQGKGRQYVKTEIEKNNFSILKLKCKDGIYDYLKVVMRSYEGEKETEYDVSFISKLDGLHRLVDRKEITAMFEKAKIQIEEDRKMNIDN